MAEFDKGFPLKAPAISHSISLLLPKLPEAGYKSLTEKGIDSLEDLRRFSGNELLHFPGISPQVLTDINNILRQYGQPEKLFPHDPIFSREYC